MTTALDICTRALRRCGVIDALHTPSAEEARDALIALNEMLFGWKGQGCNLLLQSEFASGDTWAFFLPPADLESSAIDALSYQGTWNASTNSPTLASSSGTKGYAYKVSTAGSTTLDDVTSWAVGDYAVYAGTEWLRSERIITAQGAVIALLAQRLCGDYGMKLPPGLVADAARGWYLIQSYYVKPPSASFDAALTSLPSNSSTVSLSVDDS